MTNIILQIYQSEAGQWSGCLRDDNGQEIGGVAGCASPDDVKDSVAELGYDAVNFEIV